MTTAIVYPTSADPPTKGHADILQRIAAKFDIVYWVAADNIRKKKLFSLEERLLLMEEYKKFYKLENVLLDTTESSIVRFAINKNVKFILRGIRNYVDMTFEQELATANRNLCPQIETLFILAKPEYITVSSSLVRELIYLGEQVEQYVIPSVAKKTAELMRKKKL